MKIFSLTSNPTLTKDMCRYLNTNVGEISLKRFKDGEIFPEILENVRGEDVFLVQSTNAPANDHIMELLLTIDAARRGSAKRITAVMPYFGYARQDRKTSPRSPISAKLMANLLTNAGVSRILTLDLHSAAVQGFFDIPVDNLYAAPVLIPEMQKRFKGQDIMVVSPDVGGVVRARSYASKLNCDLAIIDKRRPEAGVAEVMNIIGDVKDRICILVDDMVDSAGTLCKAADALIENGAADVYAYCSHGVFSGNATERIQQSKIKELVVTNSIAPTPAVEACDKIRVHSVASFMGEAIKRIHEERSVSSLFDIEKVDIEK